MSYTYKYQRPALTADCVVFGLDNVSLKVLLIQRKIEPFKDYWALPGGFVEVGESCDDAAKRELVEETGLKHIFLEQLYTFSAPERDPREHVVTVAYYALINLSEHSVKAGSDASHAEWYDIHRTPDLAFDHTLILETAIERLRGKVGYQPIGFELLPRKFPLRQLQYLYETILDRKLDKRNFRRKILKMGILRVLNEKECDVLHRPSQLYSFDKLKYREMVHNGFNYEI